MQDPFRSHVVSESPCNDWVFKTEGVGFEPTLPFGRPVFKTGAKDKKHCAGMDFEECGEKSGLKMA